MNFLKGENRSQEDRTCSWNGSLTLSPKASNPPPPPILWVKVTGSSVIKKDGMLGIQYKGGISRNQSIRACTHTLAQTIITFIERLM